MRLPESLTAAVCGSGLPNDGNRESERCRIAERDAEQKAVIDTRSEVKNLMADSSQLMNRLETLRKTFQNTYQQNIENLGKH